MMRAVTFTSTLPPDLLDLLDQYSSKLGVPKNRIIEKSLVAYFEKLKRAEYIESFKRAAGDPGRFDMAEEGLDDYIKILDEL